MSLVWALAVLLGSDISAHLRLRAAPLLSKVRYRRRGWFRHGYRRHRHLQGWAAADGDEDRQTVSGMKLTARVATTDNRGGHMPALARQSRDDYCSAQRDVPRRLKAADIGVAPSGKVVSYLRMLGLYR